MTCCATSRCTSPTWRSSTSACRRPTPTRGCARRARSASASRAPASSSSPSTSRPGTRWRCSPTSAEGVGYLLKDRVSDLEQFADAVRRVADGGSALDPAVVGQLVGRRRRDDPLDELTAARARGARADGRGPLEPGDRGAAVRHAACRREARHEHLHEARPAGLHGRSPPRAGRARVPPRLGSRRSSRNGAVFRTAMCGNDACAASDPTSEQSGHVRAGSPAHIPASARSRPCSALRPIRVVRGAGGVEFDAALPHTADIVASSNAPRLRRAQRAGAVRGRPVLPAVLGLAYVLLHFVGTAVVLVWVHRRHPVRFPSCGRRSSRRPPSRWSASCLLPCRAAAPRRARLLGHRELDGLNLSSDVLGALYNPFAAVPSLHFGYALIVGVALAAFADGRSMRIAGALYPVPMLLIIVATGNHFFFDAAPAASSSSSAGSSRAPVVATPLRAPPPRGSRRAPAASSAPRRGPSAAGSPPRWCGLPHHWRSGRPHPRTPVRPTETRLAECDGQRRHDHDQEKPRCHP